MEQGKAGIWCSSAKRGSSRLRVGMSERRRRELLARVPLDHPRRPRGPDESPREFDEDGSFASDELEAEFGSDGDWCLLCFFFVFIPPLPEYPPRVPSVLITLWQGILGAYGFLAHALATARADLGLFTPIATSL